MLHATRRQISWRILVTAMSCSVAVASGVLAAESVADPALVLHYVFDKDPGAVAQDLSGHGNDGKSISWYCCRCDG